MLLVLLLLLVVLFDVACGCVLMFSVGCRLSPVTVCCVLLVGVVVVYGLLLVVVH